MKYINALKTTKKSLISLEIIPPPKGAKVDELYKSIDSLMKWQPQFINVTNHQPETEYKNIDGQIVKLRVHKKPGTVGVAAAIQSKYNIEAVPHLICGGINKFDLEDTLVDLEYLGVNNVFVIRGDAPKGAREFKAMPNGFKNANQMVNQIYEMNQGIYTYPLENAEPSDFCIGVAGYPEKHFEALNLEEDLKYLKQKVDAGADYIITQMFFDVDKFFEFEEKAKQAGINVPIIPGIKPIIRQKFLKTIPRAFYIDIPKKLCEAFDNAKTKAEELEAGTSYVAEMVTKLLDNGVKALHIFTMGQGKSTNALLKRVFG